MIKESDKESNKGSVNKSNKNSIERFKEMIEKREEELIKDLREEFGLNNKSKTNWYDKTKFNEIITTIDSNNLNHKNKISKFKFNDINNLINNIKNNTISEANPKKKINELNEIKKVETKGKGLIDGQKILLNLFDDLKTIFHNNNNNNSNNSNYYASDSENESVNENENENENESENESENENENESENESNDEQYYEIEQINNNFKKTDETKSFKDQLDILKEIPWLNDSWYKMLVNDIKINRDKIFERDEFNKFVIKQAYKRGDLLDTVRVILKFSEILSLDLT